MSGKVIVVALAIFTCIFGGALWYFQTQAFYATVTDVDEIIVQGDCFDAPALQKGIDDGPLRPITAAENEPWGFDRIVATWPDGTGVMWRQMNRCGKAQFEGEDLPEGCPPAPADKKDR